MADNKKQKAKEVAADNGMYDARLYYLFAKMI